MAAWTLVPCLVQLRTEFNALAPGRDHASDGSIGDAAHSSSSDHTPDEISDALRGRDADRVNEVHAIDVDADLRTPGLSMEQVVQHLLARCRSGAEKRLRYIIFNRRIWTSGNNWRQQTYTGLNPHDKHAHFSATYVTQLEASEASWHLADLIDMPTPEEFAAAVWDHKLSNGTTANGNVVTLLARSGEQRDRMAAVPAQFAAIASAVAQIVPQDVDEDALAAALAARLPGDADDITPEELKQAIVGAAQDLFGTPAGA